MASLIINSHLLFNLPATALFLVRNRRPVLRSHGATHAHLSLPNPLYSALASATLFDTGAGRNTDPCAGGRRAAVDKENTAGGPAHGFDSDKPAARSDSYNTEYDQLSVSETASSDRKQTTTRQLMHHASNCQDETAHLQLPFRVPPRHGGAIPPPRDYPFLIPAFHIRPPPHHSPLQALTANKSIHHISTAIHASRPSVTDIVPGSPLRHFLYKSRGNVQFLQPSYAP
jgi:hypothetical protein